MRVVVGWCCRILMMIKFLLMRIWKGEGRVSKNRLGLFMLCSSVFDFCASKISRQLENRVWPITRQNEWFWKQIQGTKDLEYDCRFCSAFLEEGFEWGRSCSRSGLKWSERDNVMKLLNIWLLRMLLKPIDALPSNQISADNVLLDIHASFMYPSFLRLSIKVEVVNWLLKWVRKAQFHETSRQN